MSTLHRFLERVRPAIDGPEAPAEKDLWAAVLLRAVRDCLAADVLQQDRRCAQKWIAGQDSTFGNFIWCCALLDVTPEKIRAEIKKGTLPEFYLYVATSRGGKDAF